MGFLIRFFMRNGIHSKRTIWMAFLALLPVACSLILLLLKNYLQQKGISLSHLFPQINFYLYLHFLLPLLSIFIGTAIIADEIEDKTLPYLLMRPLPRWQIIGAKLLASWVTSGLIISLSLGLSYSIVILGSNISAWLANMLRLFQSEGVLILGLLVYVSFFALLGGILKRPVFYGILFIFGWENLVSLFPGNVKLFTFAYYLNNLFPYVQPSQGSTIRSNLLNMVVSSRQISAASSVVILIFMAIVFSTLTIFLLYLKEYRLSENS